MKNRKESAADMFYDRFCEDYVLKYRDPGENGPVKISSYRIDGLGYVTLVRFKEFLKNTECGIFAPVFKDAPAIAFKRTSGLLGGNSFVGEVYKLIPDRLVLGKEVETEEERNGKIADFFDEHVRKTAYGEKRVRPWDLSKMQAGDTLTFLREKLGSRYQDFEDRFLIPRE